MTEHIGDLIMTIKHIWELNHSQKRELIKVLNEIQQYRALGTVEELKEAREKQIAKKQRHEFICPRCDTHNKVWEMLAFLEAHSVVYCWNCGQAVERRDWSEI